jgi:hypothetical protein
MFDFAASSLLLDYALANPSSECQRFPVALLVSTLDEDVSYRFPAIYAMTYFGIRFMDGEEVRTQSILAGATCK